MHSCPDSPVQADCPSAPAASMLISVTRLSGELVTQVTMEPADLVRDIKAKAMSGTAGESWTASQLVLDSTVLCDTDTIDGAGIVDGATVIWVAVAPCAFIVQGATREHFNGKYIPDGECCGRMSYKQEGNSRYHIWYHSWTSWRIGSNAGVYKCSIPSITPPQNGWHARDSTTGFSEGEEPTLRVLAV